MHTKVPLEAWIQISKSGFASVHQPTLSPPSGFMPCAWQVDLGVMLQHTWTYQAMCHDVLGPRALNIPLPETEDSEDTFMYIPLALF